MGVKARISALILFCVLLLPGFTIPSASTIFAPPTPLNKLTEPLEFPTQKEAIPNTIQMETPETTEDTYISISDVVTVDLDPNTLNHKSKGKWITCYIEIPSDYPCNDVHIDTILLEGIIPADPHPTNIGDYDNDGIPDIMVKFSRATLIEHLNSQTGYITLTITGEGGDNGNIGGDGKSSAFSFECIINIRVI